jgi:prolyl-tRNA synthetase
MRTRLFLRTAEFLWQEGHTAHATAEEAVAETRQMLDVYAEFAEEHMAVPVVKGVKTPNERFAGAEDTYCIEALMQDGKALQAGTSHFLGQNFAKAFDVQFANKEGGLEYVWGTSWGVSTRLMGALVMAHSDDDGLVLPPKLAPIQVVIVPIYKTGELDALLERIRPIQQGLIQRGISVKLDSRDTERPGFKFAEWELKGVPVRLAIGARDLDAGMVEVVRRDTKEKMSLPLADIVASVDQLLTDIQTNIYQRAKHYRDQHMTRVDSYDEFKQVLDGKGGFVLAHYDGTSETEERIKDETKATVRCLALAEPDEEGICMVTGRPSTRRAYFARAY